MKTFARHYICGALVPLCITFNMEEKPRATVGTEAREN